MRSEDFVHRENYDGSFNSICVHCGALLARAANTEELTAQEEEHACLQAIVAKMLRRHTYIAA